jgi:tol-pal system protein YbgF
MWATRTALLVGLLAVGTVVSAAPSRSELDARLLQLERKLDSRGLVDLMEQVSALQRQVQELRGEIEVQTNAMENLQKRQRELYLDIDRRLHRLEAGGVQGGQVEVPSAAGMAAPVTAPTQAPLGAPAGAAQQAGTAAPAAAPPGAALNPVEERKDYDRALEILKEGRYSEAAPAFQSFLKKYPASSYADNAQYWLGEVYYVTREFQPALAEFGEVVAKYPQSPKVADAKLKMGYIHYEMKAWDKARELLSDVVASYPGTTTERLAQERLERMKREGH